MNAVLRRLWPFQRPPGKGFRVVGLTKDRRTAAEREALRAAQQAAADLALERQWRENIRRNEQMRALQKAQPEDPESEFLSWQDEQADSAGVPRFGEI